MNKPKILVTSAAGHTGAAAVHELLKKNIPVRAFAAFANIFIGTS